MVKPFLYDACDSSSAFRDSRSTHLTFGKNPDGTCWRKVVTNDNGHRVVDSQIVDCAIAELEIAKQQEKVQQNMKEQQHKINKEFQKVHQDIANTQKKIEEDMKLSMSGFGF